MTTRGTTTTKPVLSLADARSRYEAAAGVLNPRVASLKHALTADSGDFVKLKGDYQALADAYREFDAALRQMALPDPSSKDAPELLKADTILELVLQSAAYSANRDSMANDEAHIASAASIRVGYAKQLRTDLGLANNEP